MTTAAMAFPNRAEEKGPKHTLAIYYKESKYEFLKNLRLRIVMADM